MKKLSAKYNGEIIYIHYVSKFLEYVLVSRDEAVNSKQFKLNRAELTDVLDDDLYKKLREQEEEEQKNW